MECLTVSESLGSVNPSNTTKGSNRVGGGSWRRAARPLCFYLSDVWESLTIFFEERATHWEVESPWPTGFIHLLSTYYVPDIVLSTGDTAVKQTKSPTLRSLCANRDRQTDKTTLWGV